MKRDEKRAFWAKHFVKTSFENTKSLNVDFKIDTSINNVDKWVAIFLNFYHKRKCEGFYLCKH
ncbi:hypothetical protein GF322_04840 [Candidatus Dependentiae bacterium]|nr:hypothetical protein [Candidatus Dependentiae bacterium]